MEAVTYNLRDKSGSSNHYYDKIKSFATKTLDKAESDISWLICEYRDFLINKNIEAERSKGEYIVEVLTIGILWKRYLAASQNTSLTILSILEKINKIRSKYQQVKPAADKIKGVLLGDFVVSKINKQVKSKSKCVENFEQLIVWLNNTGEFKDEVKRIRNWLSFFRQKDTRFCEKTLSQALEITNWFETESVNELSAFDGDLENFLANISHNELHREDILLREKHRVEYYLNMVGAELMNRGFSEGYKSTKKKVLLVPGCMRIHNNKYCKAVETNLDIKCSYCNEKCEVSRLSKLGKDENFKVFIVPHSSTFTKWLKRWNSDPDTGLIAVACLLHLVPGGYEMRELNLNAQCVLLDYCGCKKHWHPEGIPTGLNTSKVLELLN